MYSTIYTQVKTGLANYQSVTISVYDAGGELVGTPSSLTFSGSGNNLSAATYNLSVNLPSAGQYSLSYTVNSTIYRTALGNFTYSGGYYTGSFPTSPSPYTATEQFAPATDPPIGADTNFPTGIDVNGSHIYFGKNPNNHSVASFLLASDLNGIQLRNFGSLNNVQIGGTGPNVSSSWTWELTNNLATLSPSNVLMTLDSNGLVVKGSPVLTSAGAGTLFLPASPVNIHVTQLISAGSFFTTGSSATLGTDSVAFGFASQAPGDAAFAAGDGAIAEGWSSFAGASAVADRDYAAAFNGGYAHGYAATAVSNGYSEGDFSFSAAAGIAIGGYSVGLAYGSATGSYSVALAAGSAEADSSFAVGVGIRALSTGQQVFGRYNDTRTNDANTDHTQGVFIVGAGTDGTTANRKNAIRVLGDGTVLIRGSGDISMGDFQSGVKP